MLYIRLHLAVFPNFVNLSPKEWFRYHHFGVLRYNLELFLQFGDLGSKKHLVMLMSFFGGAGVLIQKRR